MPLIGDIRKFFSKKRSVAVLDLNNGPFNDSNGPAIDQQIASSGIAAPDSPSVSELKPDGVRDVLTLARSEPNIVELVSRLRDDLNHLYQRSERISETLEALRQTSGQQNDVLGLLQQQLDENARNEARILDATGGIPTVLSELSESHRGTAKIMSDIANSVHERESRLTASLRRFQYWMIGAIALCAAAAVAALILSILIFQKV